MAPTFSVHKSQTRQPLYFLGGRKVADPDWCFKDREGHAHFWCKTPEGDWILPSLNEVTEDSSYWSDFWEDVIDDITVTYECKVCKEVVEPGYKCDTSPVYQYGSVTEQYYVDDQLVSEEVFRQRLKDQKEGLVDGL